MLRKWNCEHFVGSPICPTFSTSNSAWQFSTFKEKKNRNSSECFKIYKHGGRRDFIIIKKKLCSLVTHWPLKNNALLYLWDRTLINFNLWARKVRVSSYQTQHHQWHSFFSTKWEIFFRQICSKEIFPIVYRFVLHVFLNVQEKKELCNLPQTLNLWHINFLLVYSIILFIKYHQWIIKYN